MATRIRFLALALSVLLGMLAVMASSRQVQAQCDPWPGGPLDDEPNASLYSYGAPLQGRGPIDRAAARALWEAWHAAGEPTSFDVEPYLKYGPNCEGGPGNPTASSDQNNGENNDNQENENEDRHRHDNDND